jgi:hypothetical protein
MAEISSKRLTITDAPNGEASCTSKAGKAPQASLFTIAPQPALHKESWIWF